MNFGFDIFSVAAVLILYTLIGLAFAVVAWRARRRWGARGLILLWLGSAAVVTALMVALTAFQLDRRGFTPEQRAALPVLQLFLPLWLTALGASALVIQRRHARGQVRFDTALALRAVGALFGGILLFFLVYAAIDMGPAFLR